MLTAAIPEYRLPREVLQREIAALLNQNIEMRFGQALGRDFTIDKLLEDGYKAVFIATGSHASKKLDLPGEDAAGIIPGIQFLKAYNLEGKSLATGASASSAAATRPWMRRASRSASPASRA